MRGLRLRYALALGLPLAALEASAECPKATVCGAVAEGNSCGKTGDQLVSYHSIMGIQSSYGPHDPTLAALGFDAGDTKRLRDALGTVPGVERYCCYSGCGPTGALESEATCGIDAFPGFICGAVAEPDARGECGEQPSSLKFVGEQSLVGVAQEPTKTFRPDDALTRSYRERLTSGAREANYCCYSGCTPVVVSSEVPTLQERPGSLPLTQCVPEFENSNPSPTNARCAATLEIGGVNAPLWGMQPGQCCYLTGNQPEQRHPRGRPLRVTGESRQATLCMQDTWGAGLEAEPVEPVLAEQLANAWTDEGLMEHASVAAFSRLALQLMAHGAPWDIVDAAHEAARDEVLHARAAFSLASAYRGAPVAPGAFADAVAPIDVDLRTLAHETLVDGCIGEAIAAEEARGAARVAKQPGVAMHLEALAAEEARHAELSWRILGWLRERHPDVVRDVVCEVTAELMAEHTIAVEPDCCDRVTRPYGLLCAHERAAIRSNVVFEVVLPILQVAIAV